MIFLIQEGQCELMGLYGVLIQLIIALLSILSLFIKRFYERPKRKEKIFLLDLLKQCLSMSTIHIVNVLVSIAMDQTDKQKTDQCASYLVSFILDVFFGIGLTYLVLRLFNKLITGEGNEKCQQGDFIEANGEISWEAYIIQTLVWIGLTLFVKIFLFVIFYANFQIFNKIAQLLLKPFEFSQVLKLIMVMVVVPFLSNILTFFIFDQLIKKKETKNQELDLRYFDIAQNPDEDFNMDEIREKLI